MPLTALALLTAPALADTGLNDCQSDDVVLDGQWNGLSCHFPELDPGICLQRIRSAGVGVACAEGSTLGFRAQPWISDLGAAVCDYDRAGELVGETFSSDGGYFCCEGNRTDLTSTGFIEGTCLAPTVLVPEGSGCGHRSFAPALLGLSLLLRRRRVR